MSEVQRPDEPDLSAATRPLGSMAQRTPAPSPSTNVDRPPPPLASPAPPVASPPAPPVAPSSGVSRIEWTSGKALSGRYVMIEKLGEGGMGTVYLAEDLLLRRRVALKTLWEDQAFEPGDIERFRKEVALAHSVSHPNVARTYDLGESGGVHYITMEYLRGETLMTRIRRGLLTSQEVRDLAVPLCRGLRAAHRVGVVHRDLKPANVMLVPDHRKVVVMDFGIAASVAESQATRTQVRPTLSSPTSSSSIAGNWGGVTSAGLGTPVYMAPEQWDEQTGDQRTDIYALGVILYICLTGQAPYAAEDAEELGQLHKTAPVPDPSKLAKDVDPHLARLVMHCLAKKPADRPASMDEVLERLERPQRRKTYALQMAASVVGAALVLGLVGVGIYSFVASTIITEVKPGLRRLAQLVARDLDPKELAQLKTAKDVASPAFAHVAQVMKRYQADNPEIDYFYVMRPGDSPGLYYYVFDPTPFAQDKDGDGVIEKELDEHGTPPGTFYDGRNFPKMESTLRIGKADADDHFAWDEYQFTLSGYAVVKEAGQPTPFLVGVDITNELLTKLQLKLAVILGLAYLAVVVALGVALSPSRVFQRALRRADRPAAASDS